MTSSRFPIGALFFVAGIAMVICAGVLAFVTPMATGFAGSHVAKHFDGLIIESQADAAAIASAAGLPATTSPEDVAWAYLLGEGHATSFARRTGWIASALLALSGVMLCIAAWVLPPASDAAPGTQAA